MDTNQIHIQSLLYYSSDRFEAFLRSILNLETEGSKVFFHITDQSENLEEYRRIKDHLDRVKNTNDGVLINLDKQPNYGFGKGHNFVFERHKDIYNEYFVIINPDSILPFDLVKKVIKSINQLKEENWGLLEIEQFPSEHPKYYNPKTLETDWCSGAGLIIRKEAFENIGKFDENIFMYGEDVDLSMRMRRKGYKLIHLPQVTFTHLTKDTDISTESNFTRIHKQAAELYLRYKFVGESEVENYIRLLDKDDPNYKDIVEMYKEMKESLKGESLFKKFISYDKSYTNFRWTL